MTASHAVLLSSASKAVTPWNSIDAYPVEDLRTIRTGETFTNEREIQMCLNCTRVKCNNCLDGWKMLVAIRPHKPRGRKKH